MRVLKETPYVSRYIPLSLFYANGSRFFTPGSDPETLGKSLALTGRFQSPRIPSRLHVPMLVLLGQTGRKVPSRCQEEENGA